MSIFNAGSGATVATRLVAESEATFTGLPLHVALRITATASNDAGESQPSAPITITMG